MGRKYELVKEDTIKVYGKVLYRIRALKDFSGVKAGQLGGYIETEENLSHKGLCWVSDNAHVSNDAWVYDNARISNNARVTGDARVSDNSRIYGNAHIFGRAQIAWDARVSGNARVSDNACVSGDAQVSDNAWVSGNAHVSDNAWVSGNAHVYGSAQISGDAQVSDNAWVSGNTKILKDANIRESSDCIVVGPIGSRVDYTTFYTSKTGEIMVSCGCFNGTIDEFIKAVNNTHKDNETYRNQYLYTIEYIKNMKLGGK